MFKRTLICTAFLSLSIFTGACTWGQPSEKPPLHLWLDMDDQPKFEAYESNDFFKDGNAMRTPVTGTVARGGYKAEIDSEQSNPLPLTRQNLELGRQRYDIYCTPCHGEIGNGKGIIAERGATLGYVMPSSFHDATVRNRPDGHYYVSIRDGIRNMGPYGSRISDTERWAIVHYVRALQRSQAASSADLPEEVKQTMETN